nr:hypothetical protein GCM10020241_35590 [Streptoalloteichus tenebrarius]
MAGTGVTWLGTPAFPRAARGALADTQLRRNLRKATHTIRDKRAAAVAELADWERLRRAGAAIKDSVLANLDVHLERLEAAVTARGGVVHWARDADEANAIILRLVRAAGADEVVKVKSMATAEIGLNEALAEGGVRAVETDLAELIVQLGRDRPSHILVPAIHRNRAEIREIFRREMPSASPGLTDDPRELADAARHHLRLKFLSARVAVSGANFAVADTGSVVVVESEGNGRMCLTLPETLITVMGIEKVVPTWRDLEVFLQLLPRSSTAERMNPYTSVWTGVTPGDGPRQFHLVLLDNGRTDTLADEVGPAGAALHPVLGLPELLPRLRADGRAGVRVGLPRADRGDPHAATAGRPLPPPAGLAALRVVVVRRVFRGLPGAHRHPQGPGAPAVPRRGRQGRPVAGGGGDGGARLDHAGPRPVRGGATGGVAGPPAGPAGADQPAAVAGVAVDVGAGRARAAPGVVPGVVEAQPWLIPIRTRRRVPRCWAASGRPSGRTAPGSRSPGTTTSGGSTATSWSCWRGGSRTTGPSCGGWRRPTCRTRSARCWPAARCGSCWVRRTCRRSGGRRTWSGTWTTRR